LPRTIVGLAQQLDEKIAVKVRGAMVGLALDGWTKWNHTKTVNFVMIWNGTAVFWKTVESRYGKSASTMFSLVKVAIEAIERKCALALPNIATCTLFIHVLADTQ
jgi:hypothetical protein